MGLSESEKRVLEELERNLYAEDASFAKKSKAKIDRAGQSGANSPAKVVAGVLISVIGISILVFAAITQIPPFGVAGFLVMLFGILMASATAKVASTTNKASEKTRSGTFFEDRWNKRSGE
jgi:F0F1-type ATP synthase assembly protein I